MPNIIAVPWCFSTGKKSSPHSILPMSHLESSRVIFGCENWGRKGHLPGMLLNILQHTGQTLTTKRYLAQNINSASFELCSTLTSLDARKIDQPKKYHFPLLSPGCFKKSPSYLKYFFPAKDFKVKVTRYLIKYSSK